jgi:hypothetical protein
VTRPSWRVAAIALAAVLAVPRLTVAQGSDSASCLARQLPIGTAQDTVMLDIRTLPDSALTKDYEGLLLEGVAEEFHAPAVTQVPVFNHWQRSMGGVALSEAGSEVEGEVAFDVDAKGQITHVTLTASTLEPALDDSLTQAVSRLAASGMVPPPPAVPGTGKAFVLVGIRSVRGYSPLARPLYRESVQIFPLAHDVAELPNNPPITYPILPAEARVGDSVEVDFVVDEAGRVLPGTTRILRGHYLNFMQALARGVSKFRFQPAMIGSCPIKMRWQYTYVFRTTPG